MALVHCPECNGNVSDKAAACPECGCPINKHAISPFGGFEPAKTVRPDFWHDPNVGAVAAFVFIILAIVVVIIFLAILGH